MVIDFHTHTFPDKIAPGAIANLEQKASVKAFTNGTVDGLLKSMEEAGVDISVVLPVVTNPVKADKINMSAAKINEENKGILSFGGIHPDTEDYKAVIKNAANMGLKGLKLHPEYQQVEFDDIRYLRILDYTEELGLTTVVHAGYDGGYPESEKCRTRHILNVIERVKPKKLVLAHMGGCNIWDDVKKYIAGADVYFDTAFSFGAKQVPGLHLLSEQQFIDLARVHGTKKIIFGTDSPWSEQRDMVDVVKNSALTDEEKEDILSKNALKLL